MLFELGHELTPEDLTPRVAVVPDGPLRRLGRNLRAGLRAALFLRVRLSDLRSTSGQVIVLVLLLLGVQVVGGLLHAGIDAELDIDALPRAVVYVPLLLLAAWVIAQRESSPALLTGIPTLFCAATIPYELAFAALDALESTGWLGAEGYEGRAQWAWYSLYGLWLAAALTAILRLAHARWRRTAAHAATMVALVIVPAYFFADGPLWTAREEDGAGGDKDWYAVSREDVFYAQPALLERALAALRPGRKGVQDLYFVGVAGDAAQDVFMKELDVIGELFRSRFDTGGRMVTLVNNPKTVDELPVATSTALARTLEQVGRAMNREEDVLFLYLTSHGSQDHRLSMQFWPLRLNDIDPKMLKQMLDRAGVKWRVLAISACYSGGFIEPLKNEHTMIVTAADARHTSFGCNAESDFTYFAKAYFDEALRVTYSFPDAFRNARAAIMARERAEALTPSNPQIFLGSAIRPRLESLTERLRASNGAG